MSRITSVLFFIFVPAAGFDVDYCDAIRITFNLFSAGIKRCWSRFRFILSLRNFCVKPDLKAHKIYGDPNADLSKFGYTTIKVAMCKNLVGFSTL